MTQFEIPAYMPSLLLHFLMHRHGNHKYLKSKFCKHVLNCIHVSWTQNYSSSQLSYVLHFLSYHVPFNFLEDSRTQRHGKQNLKWKSCDNSESYENLRR